jgi:uncharacterized FAD-dependent dehydrogenase
MGYKSLDLKLATGFTDEDLKRKISKNLQVSDFTYTIENKSLDARNKRNIHWIVKVGVFADAFSESTEEKPSLEIPYKKRNKKVIVIGSGPAGFFAAHVLQQAGFDCTLLERGMDVGKRAKAIQQFERGGNFSSTGNYAFGEGGAGTFSDGKLTSRSKRVSLEKEFITQAYIKAGAPKEIAYMKHPHLGSDNLRKIVKALREDFIAIGGTIHFETAFIDIKSYTNKSVEIESSQGIMEAQHLVMAIGHSATDTYKMLINRGIPFRTKNFAIGSRAEHPQHIINQAQWGVKELEGVKAAEYRLSAKIKGGQPVYSFCMCPGGVVVPAAAFANQNIVNGMSYYSRNGKFANAACVSGLHPDDLVGRTATAMEALNALEKLEEKFYNFTKSYEAPYCSIQEFIDQRFPKKVKESTYPFGLTPAPLWDMLPKAVVPALQTGLKEFSRKLKGYNTGILLGLESKTSSPIQVLRDKSGLVEGFDNIYMVGEGSGYAGGIMSSAADGIKAAMHILNK